MESPSRWGQSFDDALPSTTSFVVPGQEDLFMLESAGVQRLYQAHGGGSMPASPSHIGGTWPGDQAHQVLSLSPQQPGPSQNTATQHPNGYYAYAQPLPFTHHDMLPPQQQQLRQSLAALDLAGPAGSASPSPSRGGFVRSSPTAAGKGYQPPDERQWPHAGTQHQRGHQSGYHLGNQFGHQFQRQALQLRGGQALDARFAAAAKAADAGGDAAAAADAGAGAGVGGDPYYMQYQRQRGEDPLRASRAEPGLFSQPGPPGAHVQPPPQQPQHQQQWPWGGAAPGPGEVPAGLPLRAPPAAPERGGSWGGPDAAPACPQPSAAAAAAQSPASKGPAAGPSAAPPRSPRSASPAGGFGFPSLTAVGGQHGAVRHVVDELRTSPLHPSAAFEAPAGGVAGGRGGVGGGSAQAGGRSAEKDVASQRYQAQILSLERHNAELQRRVADLQGALEAARQSRQTLEAKQDDLLDQVAQANGNAKARESALEAGRRANDALSSELRSCQEELAAARDAVAASKDTAVQWQDRAMEAAKELEAARRKIEALCEEERRLGAENMALRKEVQQLNDVIIKGRIETSELREKLRLSQQDAARATNAAHAVASRAESEQEGAAAQLVLMRNRIVELEARNGQLQYDLAGMREEAAMARQAEEAAKAALAARPAGIMTDLDPTARQYGTLTQNWLAPRSFGAAAGRPSLASPRASVGPAAAPAQAEAATAAAVLHGLPSNVAFSQLDPDTFRSMVRAEAAALARAGSGGDAAAAAAAPSSPQYQPSHSSRYGGGGGGGGLAAEPSSASTAQPYWAPPSSSSASAAAYDSRGMYDAKGPGGVGPPESPPTRYGPGGVRDSLQALLPDPRASWAAPYGPRQLQQQQQQPQHLQQPSYSQLPYSQAQAQAPPLGPPHGGGGGGGYGGAAAAAPSGSASASSPPPPYATYTDGSYAFRRPPNGVGAGVAGGKADTPFGTEETAKDMLARSKALEDQLMVLCSEKGSLEAEYARMPLGAGRSLRERNRKAVVEQRLDLLNKEISSVRMQLKRLGLK